MFPTIDLKEPEYEVLNIGIEKAMEKLRANKLLVRQITVTAATSAFADGYSSINEVVTLPCHTNDTLIAAQLVSDAIARCYKKHKFVRSMICLTSLCSDDHFQPDLLVNEQTESKRELMRVMDRINKGNQQNIFLGRSPKKNEWSMRRDFKSPEYTTCWKDLPVIKC